MRLVLGVLMMLALCAGTVEAQKKTLVIALNQDPDILDPTLSRSYVGRIVRKTGSCSRSRRTTSTRARRVSTA
jgi:hypothetical protein